MTPPEIAAQLRALIAQMRSFTTEPDDNQAIYYWQLRVEDWATELTEFADLLAGVEAHPSGWQPIETAPKGGFPAGFTGKRLTTDPVWVEPPQILACYEDGKHIVVVYWDYYYDVGGNGYEQGRTAWVEAGSGDRAAEYGELTHWMPLPAPPTRAPEAP